MSRVRVPDGVPKDIDIIDAFFVPFFIYFLDMTQYKNTAIIYDYGVFKKNDIYFSKNSFNFKNEEKPSLYDGR